MTAAYCVDPEAFCHHGALHWVDLEGHELTRRIRCDRAPDTPDGCPLHCSGIPVNLEGQPLDREWEPAETPHSKLPSGGVSFPGGGLQSQRNPAR